MAKNDFIEILDEYYPSNKSSKKHIVNSISEHIDENIDINPDELNLVIDEAITNAMEHGNKWDSKKKVHVKMNMDSKNLYIKITDEGSGFDTGNIEEKLNIKNVFSQRGRGLCLINEFCIPRWNKKGNQLTLLIKLKVN
ncbi:MAG: ATP-binding protein [bacterium]|nr:ATP-binding protein [bacterium]